MSDDDGGETDVRAGERYRPMLAFPSHDLPISRPPGLRVIIRQSSAVGL